MSALHAPICADAWSLDPAVTMLNHGSFGACPRRVLERQAELQRQMESQPVDFLVRRMQPLLDKSRGRLARLIGVAPENVVFVTNATSGVNAVLRSLRFSPGDEVLITSHAYNACANVVRYLADREGVKLVTVEVSIPVESSQAVVDAVLSRVTTRTRLAMVDHVTSATGMVFPIAQIVGELRRQGIETLVDGAHAPGMLAIDVAELGAAYYTGNCHKWLCAPKGAGFLYVRPDCQEGIQPPVISHGYNQAREGYTALQTAFDWQGTNDPTPWLCVGEAIEFVESLVPGGIEGLMGRNRDLAIAARRLLCQRSGMEPICGEEMVGSMAAMIVPPAAVDWEAGCTTRSPMPPGHWLGSRLRDEFGVEVPVYGWPGVSRPLVRISAQAYNCLTDYERLADSLDALLRGPRN
jgi:isopenicillin-N epimerase